MKTVEWIGPERVLGIYGYVKVGVIKELPDAMARQFIKMGWCTSGESKSTKTRKSFQEGK